VIVVVLLLHHVHGHRLLQRRRRWVHDVLWGGGAVHTRLRQLQAMLSTAAQQACVLRVVCSVYARRTDLGARPQRAGVQLARLKA
jgi:hypothetical protein